MSLPISTSGLSCRASGNARYSRLPSSAHRLAKGWIRLRLARGTVAAPVFHEVAAATLRSLSVPPDAPTLNVKLPPADAPVIKEDVWVAREDSGPRG